MFKESVEVTEEAPDTIQGILEAKATGIKGTMEVTATGIIIPVILLLK